MKAGNSINIFYIEKIDINKVESIINMIISRFRKWFNDFLIEDRIIF